MLRVFVPLRVALHPKGGLDPEVFRVASDIWGQPSLGGKHAPCALALLTENSKVPVPEALRMEARGLGELFWQSSPGGSHGQESACNAGDPGSIPGPGRSP